MGRLGLRRRARVLGAGAVSAVAVVVVASYGYAAITANDQTYTGCLHKGEITAVAIGTAPLKACAKGETQISWNQTGPQGEQGVQGIQGPKGDKGEPGQAASGGITCPDRTMNGGTNDVVVSRSGGKGWGSLYEQLDPEAYEAFDKSVSVFACVGTISNFNVTASGSPGPLGGYSVSIRVAPDSPADAREYACTIFDPATTCGWESSIVIAPGDSVWVFIDYKFGFPDQSSFDWSADLAPPERVYP